MTRVLVTGATGFIGGHVTRELLRAGYTVRALARPASEALVPRGCETAIGDILDPRSLSRAVAGCDAIVHAAAVYALARHLGPEMMRANVTGTANVVEAARRAGVRLVHTSSVATIGLDPDGAPADEDTPVLPGQTVGPYKRSKVRAEELVLRAAETGLWATVVNPSAPIGPDDRRPTPTGRIVRDFLRGRIPAVVDTGLSLVDVRDVAVGHRLALERGVPGRRYILGNAAGNLTLREILEVLAEISGRRAPRVRMPHAVAIVAAALDEILEGTLLRREPSAPLDGARMARHAMFFTARRAVAELGLPQSPVHDALAAAVYWYRAQDGR